MNDAAIRACPLFVAPVTPFVGHDVDHVSFPALVRAHARATKAGLLVAGTTGEALALAPGEITDLVRDARLALGPESRPLMAGIRAESPEAVVAAADQLRRAGADLLLLGPPLAADAAAGEAFIREAVPHSALPVVLYENPAIGQPRLGVDAIRRLLALRNVVAVKDSTGDEASARALLESGYIGSARLARTLGLPGLRAVLGLANLYPRTAWRLLTSSPEADLSAWDDGIAFASAHGVPGLKAALSVAGWCRSDVRPPLVHGSAAMLSDARALLSRHPLELA